MQKIIEKYLERRIFKNFFSINLTPVERNVAISSLKKYSSVFVNSFINSLWGIPAIIYLDTMIIGVILTPIAMVAGSAWFMISLSTMKAKFEKFGTELTKNIFESFVTSLFIMFLMAVYALNKDVLSSVFDVWGGNNGVVSWVSGLLGVVVVTKIIYLIAIGSIKYDTNDAMLSGQNEAAQEFFKKSLNFSYQVTSLIRNTENLKSTNYYISDAFSRIFNSAMDLILYKKKKGYEQRLEEVKVLNGKALSVLKDPCMDQDEVYEVFLQLLQGFKKLLNPDNKAARKMGYVDIEFECLRDKKDENGRTKALRYATIFTLIYEIVNDEGQDIFL